MTKIEKIQAAEKHLDEAVCLLKEAAQEYLDKKLERMSEEELRLHASKAAIRSLQKRALNQHYHEVRLKLILKIENQD